MGRYETIGEGGFQRSRFWGQMIPEPAPFFVWWNFDYPLYGIAEFLNSQTQGSINILSQENGINSQTRGSINIPSK